MGRAVPTPLQILAGVCLIAAALLFSGCAHTAVDSVPSSSFSPLPPEFLTGPSAPLLTNSAGYHAHVTFTGTSLAPDQGALAGELLGQGAKLLFAPEEKKQPKKAVKGGFSFIWDVSAGSGYVLSEALQAYAPVSMSARTTNFATAPTESVTERIDGHPCTQEFATAALSDGIQKTFRALRASDLNGLALRITSATNAAAFALELSKVQPQALPADVFAPPNGFTRYQSSETMMTELVLRAHNLKRRPTAEEPPQIYQPPQRR